MSSGRSFDTRVLHNFLLAGPCYRWPPYWKQFCFPSEFKFPCVGRSLEDESEVNDFSFFCVCVGFLKSKVHLYSLHSREKLVKASERRQVVQEIEVPTSDEEKRIVLYWPSDSPDNLRQQSIEDNSNSATKTWVVK